MRFLVFASNTLYCKSLLPISIELQQRGHEVQFFGRREEQPLTREYIYDHYNNLDVIGPSALEFTTKLIGLAPVQFPFTNGPDRYDAVLCTVQNLPHMKAFSKKRKYRRHFAVGYRSVPALLRIGEPWVTTTSDKESVLLRKSSFTKEEIFPKMPPDCGRKLFGFPYIESQTKTSQTREVLIFHPGGRRDVVTSVVGETRESCLRKQKEFFARAIVPLIKDGFHPVIKIHPLAARHHDIEDMHAILDQIIEEHCIPGNCSLIGPEGSFWEVARRCAFSLTYGSSSIYELWAAGLDNVFVCDFEGKQRSRHFKHFSDIFIHTYEEFLSFVANPWEVSDPYTKEVIEEYKRLHLQNSSPKIADLIEKECA